MNIIKNTLSLCEHCYRHVPAVSFERDGSIWLEKTCEVHGRAEHMVEPNAEFYLNYKYPRHTLQSYLIEVTNRCNLKCPHCYQLPDNMSKDPSIESLLSFVKAWPDDGYPMSLCGAEPTTRKDLPELITGIQSLPGKPRNILVLTNGVNLADVEYAKQFQKFENVVWSFGLNHPNYQGKTVRAKQIQGLQNCLELGLKIKGMSYTLENLDQMEYCLNEIQEFGKTIKGQYRVRCGADIGRYPGDPKIFLSQLVKQAKDICKKNNWTVDVVETNGNRAHYPLIINGIPVKIIQWPDVTTLDLSEMQTEAMSDILPGKPPSPLIHQVLLRDGAVNKGLPLYDTIPEEYITNYGL
jgi:molybdenum cofactor biosynthesis enzyme MoaA